MVTNHKPVSNSTGPTSSPKTAQPQPAPTQMPR